MLTRRAATGPLTLAIAALLLAGCGGDPGTDGAVDTSQAPADSTGDEGSTTATETPRSGGSRQGPPSVLLEVDSIAGVELPADVGEIHDALTAELGGPTDTQELEWCSDDPEGPGTLITLTWDNLRASGAAEEGERVQITTWEVFGPIPATIDLPRNLHLDAREDVALRALPNGMLTGPGDTPHGGKLITEGRLRVLLDPETNLLSGMDANIAAVTCE